MPLRPSLPKLTQEIKLKLIMFELFIISKLNEIYIYYFALINIISLLSVEIKKIIFKWN